MTDTLIKVDGVSKKFCRGLKRSLWYGLLDLGSELRGGRSSSGRALRPEEFWAVKDVSLQVDRGECIGLIGPNGAGKTTLLRMFNGLIKPDAGRIELKGRVGALIALGAGFHPLLTGRENIYVNATILGFRRSEVDRRFDEIVAFSELEDFIDSPVQNYSSGMFVRLGFAVAAHFQPDILLVDEALAVGDLAFTVKCLNRIAELRREGACVIFVSHSELQVREAAQRCVLIDRGRAVSFDTVDSAFSAYAAMRDAPVAVHPDAGFVHDGPVRIRYAGGAPGDENGRFAVGEPAEILLECTSTEAIDDAELELRFWDSAGRLITTVSSALIDRVYRLPAGRFWFAVRLHAVALAPGRYRLAAGFRRKGAVLGWTRDLANIEVLAPPGQSPVTGIVHQLCDITGPHADESASTVASGRP